MPTTQNQTDVAFSSDREQSTTSGGRAPHEQALTSASQRGLAKRGKPYNTVLPHTEPEEAAALFRVTASEEAHEAAGRNLAALLRPEGQRPTLRS